MNKVLAIVIVTLVSGLIIIATAAREAVKKARFEVDAMRCALDNEKKQSALWRAAYENEVKLAERISHIKEVEEDAKLQIATVSSDWVDDPIDERVRDTILQCIDDANTTSTKLRSTESGVSE